MQSTESINLNSTLLLNNLLVSPMISSRMNFSIFSNQLFNIIDIMLINQIIIDKKEFPKLSKKNHLIKCFYQDFNHEPKSEKIKTFYSKL
ncbi:MAG: hypothetical protein OEY49_20385, partial [Candidatus Heimdallarchaeota archaeon]|nr:hypothetical protein [Candidatus Heimdallarchaeota archaeon]